MGGDGMTREELRDYVEEQRNLDIIPYHVYSTLIDGIDTLEQEPRLIPVSERLPEESDYVSCLPFYDGVVIWLTDKGIMGFGWYYNSTNNWADTNDCWSDKYGKVTAWMPLPEKYKPQKSEET